jgi:parvulin-like peptidyl-prolyl isomerase
VRFLLGAWSWSGLRLVGLQKGFGAGERECRCGSARSSAASSPEDPAVADIPFDADKPVDPERTPKAVDQKPLEVAARLMLIHYAGAKNATSSRSETDAQKRAVRLVQVARQQGADFAELARKYSEAPEEGRGKIDVFREGDHLPEAFLDAAMTMGEGQVSAPVRTEFGYYVIKREALEEYSTAHILIVYKGAKMAPPALKRTKKEALRKAERVAQKAHKPGANFALLASRYSDSPSKHRGGVIARMRAGQLIDGFEPYLEAVRGLEVGAISDVVETPYGFPRDQASAAGEDPDSAHRDRLQWRA